MLMRNTDTASRLGNRPLVSGPVAVCVAVLMLVTVLTPGLCEANTPQAQLHVGRLWMNPEYDGAGGWGGSAWQYPAGIAIPSNDGSETSLKRGWVGHGRKFGTYFWSTDWTDPEGTVWIHALGYAFRAMNYNYPHSYTATDPNGHMDYVYPVSIQEHLRWERPTVEQVLTSGRTGFDTLTTVPFFPGEEGLESVIYELPDNAGTGPRPTPEIDPALVAEEVIVCKWRYLQGVECDKRMYAYPFGSPHQDYVLWDMKFTNNGICGYVPNATGDEPWYIRSNHIENAIFAQAFDYRNVASGTTLDDDDAVVYPFGAAGHPAVLCWDTDDPEVEGPDWGDPTFDDAFGRATLAGNCYALLGCLFASAGPGAKYDSDDRTQPAFIMAAPEWGVDLKGDSGYPAADPSIGPGDARRRVLGGEYQLADLSSGTTFQSDPRFADYATVLDEPGPTVILGYGKLEGPRDLASFATHGWDIGMYDRVRVVQLMASGGINVDEAARIAGLYRAAAEVNPTETASWMGQADVELVQSGADTAMKAAAMAYWNFYGEFPLNVTAAKLSSWNVADHVATKPSGRPPFDVPEAPRPPGSIFVRAIRGEGIRIVWGRESESEPDHDTGVHDLEGYRIYRQEGHRNAKWELLVDLGYEFFPTTAPQALNGITTPEGRTYLDTHVTLGKPYHYCVVAYDDGAQNWGQPGRPLESSRWWTWTGYSASGVVGPAVNGTGIEQDSQRRMSLGRNAPNPFNPLTSIPYTLPEAGDVRLTVYNVAGQLVRTLVDGCTEAGEHAALWDGTDDSGRSVASGVYLCRLTNGTTALTSRMTLVR